jgi:hypothetical protein
LVKEGPGPVICPICIFFLQKRGGTQQKSILMPDSAGYRTPPNRGGPIEVQEPLGVENQPLPTIGLQYPSPTGSPLPPSSPPFDIGQLPEEDQILQRKVTNRSPDNRAIKITKAKGLLEEILKETSDSNLYGPILEGIQILEIIKKGLQNPQEISQSNPTHQAIEKIQLGIAEINSKVDCFLEPRKPTFAEILQKPTHSQVQSQPPSPRVVIPKRTDLFLDDYPMANTSPDGFLSSKVGPSPKPVQLGSAPSRPSPRPSQSEEKQQFRARRLIIKTSMEFLNKLDSMKLRNHINDSFYQNGYPELVVATIVRSLTNLSLVITTMDNYSSSFLLEHQDLWDKFIPHTSIHQDLAWTKLIVHTVPTRPFLVDKGENLIKSEIETFNPHLRLMRNPRWLSSEEARNQKTHSSILIHLENPDMAQKAIRSRIVLAGVICRTQTFMPKDTQCDKCQGFGHRRSYCRNQTRCRICAKNHEDLDHKCQICQVSNQECPHSQAICANCGQNHKADDKKCQEWEKVKPRFIRPRDRPIARVGMKLNSNSNSNSIDHPISMDIEL